MRLTRIGLSAALVLAMSAFVGGQEKKDPPKAEPPKQEPPKQEPPKVDGKKFEPKFEVNKKFYQESTTKLVQIVKVQGQDLTQRQETTFYYEWTPLKLENEKWHVKQRVEGLKMSIDISGNVINYNSTAGDSPTAGNPGLVEFFKKLNGSEFTAVLDKNYRVEKVEGRDKFVKDLSSGSPTMETLLNNILTDEALKEMCDPTLKLVPQDGPKKVGESWKREGTVNLGPIGTYKIGYDFKYVGPDKDLDKIEVTTSLEYTVPPKDKADGLLFRITGGTLSPPKGADGKAEAAKGVILYDPKAGRVASAEIAIKLKGELKVTIGGTETTVELSQEQTTAVKMGDTSYLPGTTTPKKP